MTTKDAATIMPPRGRASRGYPSDPVVADFERHGLSAALCKPYATAQLDAAIGGTSAEGTG